MTTASARSATKAAAKKGQLAYETKTDSPGALNAMVVELCNALLADAIDLKLQAKQAHWNVKGMNFMSLHELFDKVAGEAENHVDLLAERAVQLGGIARGTVRVAAEGSRLKAYPLAIADGRAHVEALATGLAAFGANVRAAIAEAEKLEDPVTADIFTEISRATDKQLWFVEAHVQVRVPEMPRA